MLFSLFAVVSRFNRLIFIFLNRFFPLLVHQCLSPSFMSLLFSLPISFLWPSCYFLHCDFSSHTCILPSLFLLFWNCIWCCAVLITGCTGWMLRVEFQWYSLKGHTDWSCGKPSPDLLLEFVNVSEENEHWFTSLVTWKWTVGWGYLFTCLTFFLVSACTRFFPRSKMTND